MVVNRYEYLCVLMCSWYVISLSPYIVPIARNTRPRTEKKIPQTFSRHALFAIHASKQTFAVFRLTQKATFLVTTTLRFRLPSQSNAYRLCSSSHLSSLYIKLLVCLIYWALWYSIYTSNVLNMIVRGSLRASYEAKLLIGLLLSCVDFCHNDDAIKLILLLMA